jgi:hypothetical protein
VLRREDGVPFALTLERAWRDNAPFSSCIPTGTYQCVRHRSPRFGETFLVTDVPGRDNILFHKGNIDDDTAGCILVGEAFNFVKGEDGITSSEAGFAEFMRLMSNMDTFTLVIE